MSVFSLAIRSDENFQSTCTKILTHRTTSVDDCKLSACYSTVNAFHFLGNVCVLLNCSSSRLEDLRLQPAVRGWDIYVRMEPELGPTMETQTPEFAVNNGGPLPVWAIIVIAVVAVLVVVAVVVGTILAMRRRQQSTSGKDPQYINQEMSVQTGPAEYEDVAEVESPADEVTASEYEEIGGNMQYESIQPQNTVIQGPIYGNTEDPEGYQRLGPNNNEV